MTAVYGLLWYMVHCGIRFTVVYGLLSIRFTVVYGLLCYTVYSGIRFTLVYGSLWYTVHCGIRFTVVHDLHLSNTRISRLCVYNHSYIRDSTTALRSAQCSFLNYLMTLFQMYWLHGED